jgi:hypothetical protein
LQSPGATGAAGVAASFAGYQLVGIALGGLGVLTAFAAWFALARLSRALANARRVKEQLNRRCAHWRSFSLT